MGRSDRLATREFAAWWRARNLPVLYPLDLGAVPTYDVAVPDDSPVLATLRRVAAQPRLSVFLLHVSPTATLCSAVAVVGGDDAVVVAVTGDHVQVDQIGYGDMVRAVGELLPVLPPAGVPVTELRDADWSALIALLASEADEATRRARFESRGVPSALARAMIAGAAQPGTVGTVGVQVFTATGPQLGPTLLSWQELPEGALLTHVHAPRRPGPVSIELGPYRTETVLRGLTEAVSTALYRYRDST